MSNEPSTHGPGGKKITGVRGYDANDATLTVDTFIGEVPIDPRRCILVYLRKHGGRQFIRWRVFHLRTPGCWYPGGQRGCWYPDKRRAFVIPVGVAEALAVAIMAGPAGQQITPKPPWLAAIDAYKPQRILKLAELAAPPDVLEPERRRLRKGMA